jgi:hypothetical protein
VLFVVLVPALLVVLLRALLFGLSLAAFGTALTPSSHISWQPINRAELPLPEEKTIA